MLCLCIIVRMAATYASHISPVELQTAYLGAFTWEKQNKKQDKPKLSTVFKS